MDFKDYNEQVKTIGVMKVTSKLVKIAEKDPTDIEKYEDLFSSIFFASLPFPSYNSELTVEECEEGQKLFNSIGSTWNTKHEHKTTACAVILRDLCKNEKNTLMKFKDMILSKLKEK